LQTPLLKPIEDFIKKGTLPATDSAPIRLVNVLAARQPELARKSTARPAIYSCLAPFSGMLGCSLRGPQGPPARILSTRPVRPDKALNSAILARFCWNCFCCTLRSFCLVPKSDHAGVGHAPAADHDCGSRGPDDPVSGVYFRTRQKI